MLLAPMAHVVGFPDDGQPHTTSSEGGIVSTQRADLWGACAVGGGTGLPQGRALDGKAAFRP
jgi:hypothetical protein